MPKPIIIREIEKKNGHFTANLQFDPYGASYKIEISPIFADAEEKKLAWYFEEWLHFPFTDKVPAAEAAASIFAYGENLFEQVFRADPDVYVKYQQLRREDILIEIIGSPEFHGLHWEALKDPKQARPLSVDVPVVRKPETPVTGAVEVEPAPVLRVLLVVSRPGGRRDVGYRTISRPLVEALETAKIPAQVDIVRPGTYEALVKHLEDIRDTHGDGYYHILHLDMHGSLLTYDAYNEIKEIYSHSNYIYGSGAYAQKEVKPFANQQAFLLFDSVNNHDDSGGNLVSANDLAGLLNARQIPIVMLNACQSGQQVGETETSLGSHLMTAGVQLVLAMGYSVTVSAAKLLMITLYNQLLEGKDPAVAIRRARFELYNNKRRQAFYKYEIELEDWLLPVIYQNTPPKFDWRKPATGELLFPASSSQPHTQYGFFGRDIDMLAIEKHLLQRHNFLLIRGMGGAGKTTLLRHLGWWWQKTGFVKQVFYFGYDEKAYHVQEIVQQIGHQLGLSMSGIAEQDQALVLHELKSTRHLLMLDNLESVTGDPLAIPNTLAQEEQAALRTFLQALNNTKSLILLGSRAEEAWLKPHPLHEEDIHDLLGLDSESRSKLAEAILDAVNAPHYPELEEHRHDFEHLQHILGGYPIAMEVILSNLAHATPSEVIQRLQAADVNLDTQKDIGTKTKSILKCIDYSFTNLSRDAQALLTCLAPFTGVININWLPQYSEELQKHPELASLPYENWQNVLQEAVYWGLLQPHEQWGELGYWRLQPIFPYFLKTRLNEPQQAAQKKAIDEAFRELYSGIGAALAQMIQSTDAEQRQIGQVFTGVEFENLMNALHLALNTTVHFYPIYDALDYYLDTLQNPSRNLLLGQAILTFKEAYLSKENSHLLSWATIFLRIGINLQKLQHYEEAENSCKNALQLINKPEHKATILHQLGRVAEEQRQWQAAEDYYKEALQIKIDFKDHFSQASTLHQLGWVAEKQRRWQAAEDYYKEALQIKIDFKDRFSQARTLHQLGMVAEEQRQWQAAEDYYKEALQIKIDFKDRFSQARTLHQLGMVAQEQRQWQAAEDYYKEALQIYIDFKDRFSQASTLHQLGRVAQEQRRWQAAEAYYKEALQIFIDFKDRFSQASTLHQLGRVAEQQRQWQAAEDYYTEALQIKIEFQDRYSQISTLGQLGLLMEAQEMWTQAVEYTIQTAIISCEYEDRQLGIALRTLSRLRKASGDAHGINWKLAEALKISIDQADEMITGFEDASS